MNVRKADSPGRGIGAAEFGESLTSRGPFKSSANTVSPSVLFRCKSKNAGRSGPSKRKRWFSSWLLLRREGTFMVDEKWSARFRTHDEIRSRGAIGSLNDGIEITTHDVRTRLIAWPGNGFQTESVHVLTLAPGEESARDQYDMSDEAMVCFKGQARFTYGASGCRSSPVISRTFRNAFPTRSAIPRKTRAISCSSIRSAHRNSTSPSRQDITTDLMAG